MNKMMRAAHSKVYAAVRAGTLIPQPCETCGAPKAVAHHHDYNRPLDVQWLCTPCHLRQHREERKQSYVALLQLLRDTGMSYRQIEKETGINYRTIYNWLKQEEESS